jgi:hypothetical protein
MVIDRAFTSIYTGTNEEEQSFYYRATGFKSRLGAK